MATHPDYAQGEWTALSVLPGQVQRDISLILNQGGRIEGTIDSSQGGIAEREVHLYSYSGQIGWRTATSGDDGRFVIEKVVPQNYTIELRQERDSSLSVGNNLRKRITVTTGQTTLVAFGAERTITVRGMVQIGGQALSGIVVAVRPLAGNPFLGSSCKTGLEGRFELLVGGPGEYSFSVRAEGDRGSYARIEHKVPDTDVAEFSLEFPGGVLAGRVIAPDGRGAGHVPITVTRDTAAAMSGTSSLRVFRRNYTDADGRFRFQFLEQGIYTLRTPDGFRGDNPPPRSPYGRAVLPGLRLSSSPGIDDMEVHLFAEGKVFGRVVDASDNAITGALIQVEDPNGLSLSSRWETHTDSTGHFDVRSIAPGEYRVLVHIDGREEKSVMIDVKAEETTSVHIKFPQ